MLATYVRFIIQKYFDKANTTQRINLCNFLHSFSYPLCIIHRFCNAILWQYRSTSLGFNALTFVVLPLFCQWTCLPWTGGSTAPTHVLSHLSFRQQFRCGGHSSLELQLALTPPHIGVGLNNGHCSVFRPATEENLCSQTRRKQKYDSFHSWWCRRDWSEITLLFLTIARVNHSDIFVVFTGAHFQSTLISVSLAIWATHRVVVRRTDLWAAALCLATSYSTHSKRSVATVGFTQVRIWTEQDKAQVTTISTYEVSPCTTGRDRATNWVLMFVLGNPWVEGLG